MDSGNRNQPKSSSHYRENKVVEQFPPKGRRERMKRQAQALQNQPASLMAARHTGADAGEHMAAGKGRQQLWQYLTYSPHMHWILPLQWQPGFPRHCQGWQSCCAVSQHPTHRVSHWLDSVLLCGHKYSSPSGHRQLHTQSQVSHSRNVIIKPVPIR